MIILESSSQSNLYLQSILSSAIPYRKTKLAADVQHRIVFRKDVSKEALDALNATDLEQIVEKNCAKALALPSIGPQLPLRSMLKSKGCSEYLAH